MNVGDLVWAKHPRIYNAYTPGLSLFPKFTKAVAKQDWKTAYKEHKRYYTRDGKVTEMVRRNNAFAQLYLLPKLK